MEFRNDGTLADPRAATSREQKHTGGLAALAGLSGERVLVGVTYDERTREHSCAVERMQL